MNSRQQLILQTVIDKGRMSVSDLSKMTGVSEVTIRQDLNTLEKQSYLRRTHGFAVPLDSDDVETRMMNNYTVKRELADYAASLVSDGETVFIENGSCNALLARRLGEQRGITIITVSSYIAHLLKDALCDVILLGGIYQKKSESVVGPLTRQYVQQVHFSKAFIGIDGWLPDTGFTGRDMMRSDVVNAVLEKGNEAIVLTDSSKFGAVHPYTLGVGNCFNRVITDAGIPADAQRQLQESGLLVDIVNTAASL
ncbi:MULTISPECIES: DNA-binding transcriptional regulator YciT [Enterobacteriaceae]|uniref:DNA-binding transcriptional regulator YciT n=2 Tax=Enterobacteriaceae TaxID=543 RepID=A0ABW1PWI3_9ENTR|nr:MULTISPECIES: DNA-binding transcriptional regulator YciT [Phytobacter]AUU90851.1 DeoR/GlpR transcriptional regulator [Enterobacteriaceae bacterium ENNIH3]AUV09106.1 DeoR/GlpR transcriptional regulator [Enterobacteriaceae bacterium ENNIH2]MBS6739674.1 DeoR/GlpR transcriptional regulator [Enterobacteriaceae bacterium]PTA87765.1 DeoR/GlpR transcriptional regulator [Kluyvera sp. Nf5]PWF50685.1 DeoR/GlpR transcriptional regulator [[Kluyvera] intestini]PXW61247.1 DeoR family transcriptional regu